MRHPGSLLFVIGLVAFFWLQPHPAAAQEEPTPPAPSVASNVGITITITDTEGDDDAGPETRSYHMITQANGPPTSLLMGWRMPIPTSRQPNDDPDAESVISYVYQNVGMSARLHSVQLDGRQVLIKGMIEVSGKRNEPQTEQNELDLPIIGTFQQDLYVVLQDGKTLRAAEVPDPDGGTISIEIRADVMKK